MITVTEKYTKQEHDYFESLEKQVHALRMSMEADFRVQREQIQALAERQKRTEKWIYLIFSVGLGTLAKGFFT